MRFLSTYVAYNALYAEVAIAKSKSDRWGDRTAATSGIADYVGAEKLLAAYGEANVNRLIDVLKSGRYIIALNRKDFTENETENKRLEECLNGTNPKEKAKTILEVIYEVRCNMVHGSKRMADFQVDLLRVLIELLSTTVQQVIGMFEKPR